MDPVGCWFGAAVERLGMRGHCQVGRWVRGLRHARFRVFFHRRRHTSRLRQCVGVSWHLVQWIVGGQGFEVSWRGGLLEGIGGGWEAITGDAVFRRSNRCR